MRGRGCRSGGGWQQLANVVILASLPIAGCSLAVSVAGGLSDRKRPFSLLRLRAQMDYTLRPPGVEYYLIVVVGLAASLGIIASTLPLLRRITGPETARNE